jgi:hypothetical protein
MHNQVLFFWVLLGAWQMTAQPSAVHFTKHVITKDFISEGVAAADINRDGQTDIVAGAFWFEAPAWLPHEIAVPVKYNPSNSFSNSFLNFVLDVDQDGWVDQLRISLPGEEAVWYHNPGKTSRHWEMHMIIAHAGNESPAFEDVDGDGRADLICNDPVAGEMLWIQAPLKKGDTSWQRHVIAKGTPGTDRYTHGLGHIDMNDDGRKDILITKGWWQCPQNPSEQNWVFHPADLGADCSQIYQLPKAAGVPAVLVSASAHNYGIWWHRQVALSAGDSSWEHHTISAAFSQSHGLAMADINKDGLPDLVSGKRYFAHNGKDPGAFEPSVLYWFEYNSGITPAWKAHLVDDHSGIGLQAVVQDINRDGRIDIVVANKNGVYFFEQDK